MHMSKRDLLLESITYGIPNGVFVETGTNDGLFAELVLSANPTNTLYIVEHCDHYYRLKTKYGKRVLTTMPDTIDLLHIDGNNHTYDFVKDAIEQYFPKVRENGFLMGSGAKDIDDAVRNAKGDVMIESIPYGVVHAFSEFIVKHNHTGAGSDERIFFKKTVNNPVLYCPNKNIVFVTSFSTVSLSGTEAVKRLLALQSFKQDLVVFADTDIIPELSAAGGKITFVNAEQVADKFEEKYIKLAQEIQPNPGYSGHYKINLLRHVKTIKPEYMLYAWIDCSSQMNFHNCKLSTKKVTFISSTSTFIIPNSLVEAVELLYEYKLIESQTQWLTHETMFPQIFEEFPDMLDNI